MPLAGRKLAISGALAACRAAGWYGQDLVTAVAVMTAESARYVKAWHLNDDGSTDRGLFQINDHAHPDLSDADAYKAAPNVKYAHRLSIHQGFRPWAAYDSGAYAQYVDEVETTYEDGTWRLKLPIWIARMAAL